jgi:hypothetical protein
LHSHSAKSPKYGDISRWLTTTKWLVITQQKALHSHLTKLANYANLSHWLTLGKSLVIAIRLSEQTTLAKSLVMDGHPLDNITALA